MTFEWDDAKDRANQAKHGLPFDAAQAAFFDPRRFIQKDDKHSTPHEERFFCHGMVDGRVVTVRFTLRDGAIRIFGAAHWRQGVDAYEHREK